MCGFKIDGISNCHKKCRVMANDKSKYRNKKKGKKCADSRLMA
jgi:hypothetical protein